MSIRKVLLHQIRSQFTLFRQVIALLTFESRRFMLNILSVLIKFFRAIAFRKRVENDRCK